MSGAPEPTRPLRVMFYAQHLTGVGHFIRTRALAAACATRHETWLASGGQPVPGELPPRVRPIHLPALIRRDGQLAPLAAGPDLAAILHRRGALLREAVSAIRPDVLVIEHFPFSKWELAAEVALIRQAAHSTGHPCRLICSVRDIPRQTRHEAVAAEAWAARVLAELNDGFDGLMVHGDEALSPLPEHFPAAHQLSLPWTYTGLVAESCPPDPAATARIGARTGGAPFILVSVGGGTGRHGLPAAALAAWEHLGADAATAGHRLVLVGGLGGTAPAPGTGAEPGIIHLAFTADFPHWLRLAALSVSHAGYNTCASLLRERSRAVLVPDAAMADQPVRAALLAARGLADCLDESALSGPALAARIRQNMGRPRPHHELRLDGAWRSVAFIEELAV